MKRILCSLLLALTFIFALAVPAFAEVEPRAVVGQRESAIPDGTYAVDYEISTETGLQKCLLPAKLVVENGQYFVQLVFNDVEVDKLYLGEDEILPIGTTKSGYKNDIGTYQVFNLPIEDVNEDVTFVLHTRGNNLETDEYVINVAAYDESFDADAQVEAVKADNLGAQEYRFYDWHVGMGFSVWGPFVFLAVEAVALFIFLKKYESEK